MQPGSEQIQPIAKTPPAGLEVYMKPYKPISKAVVFKNPWWSYCLDQVEFPPVLDFTAWLPNKPAFVLQELANQEA